MRPSLSYLSSLRYDFLVLELLMLLTTFTLLALALPSFWLAFSTEPLFDLLDFGVVFGVLIELPQDGSLAAPASPRHWVTTD